MGVVYAAHDFGLDRRVCLKVVRGNPDDREREARLVDPGRRSGVPQPLDEANVDVDIE